MRTEFLSYHVSLSLYIYIKPPLFLSPILSLFPLSSLNLSLSTPIINHHLSMDNNGEIIDLPPGFRFHPTDEELITQYLTNKVLDQSFNAIAIGEADLNKCEPWDLPRKAKMGEKSWYFFCVKDRKYPTGSRTNRATVSGYWKATGKDKDIYRGKSKTLVGMKKTLVFYMGRAPKGQKTNWVMHEYRLDGNISPYNLPKAPKNEWVICRVFKKALEVKKPMGMGIERSNSSLIPPLMEVSSASSGNRALAATESQSPLAHVTCFSSATKMEAMGGHEEVFAPETQCFSNSTFLPQIQWSSQFEIDPSFVNLLCPGAGFMQLLGNNNSWPLRID
ncbi:hypothetical protein LUZ62_071856 [Rhynchospora pubera]|uniref:NAC domain-containing protein n=1 Tax=Rhynchospora pubera TaxID=906938 RepID=A0AAV8D250_9POAL|nr:hypothetical protein LUZ62_071856 [Rhynchospora pubera]